MEPSCALFIPVSSPSGIGEYMRSMIIAKALRFHWPDITIHFILSEQVDYIQDCPYEVHLCSDSPTKDVKNVNAIIKRVKPNLVVFDASGRASQFKQAKDVGAKVAFISQHNKKRSRGLKLNRLLSTDIHWVAQPDYCISSLNYWQRAKLALFNKKSPQNIGPVFELNDLNYQMKVLKKFNLIKETYFVFNAGSGGHKVNGELAADIYYQAAEAFYKKTAMKCIVIFGSNYPSELPNKTDVICIKSIESSDFISLISNAKACVVTAGDTLLQCIALHKPSVASPVSSDQPSRLKLCQREQLVLAAEADINSLLEQALLIFDEDRYKTLQASMSNQAPVKALDTIIEDINSLFNLPTESNSNESEAPINKGNK